MTVRITADTEVTLTFVVISKFCSSAPGEFLPGRVAALIFSSWFPEITDGNVDN